MPWSMAVESIEIAAQIESIILLFEVGLESHVDELLSVGLSRSLSRSWVRGADDPGYGVGVVLLPDEPVLLHIYLGATLAATSVGITARVLKTSERPRLVRPGSSWEPRLSTMCSV